MITPNFYAGVFKDESGLFVNVRKTQGELRSIHIYGNGVELLTTHGGMTFKGVFDSAQVYINARRPNSASDIGNVVDDLN